MTYKDKLNSFSNDSLGLHSETRAQEISNDIRSAFGDGTVFGELIANSVGEALAKMIEKSGMDDLVSNGVEGLKNTIGQAASSAFKSDEFNDTLSHKMAQAEVDREMPRAQEMGS